MYRLALCDDEKRSLNLLSKIVDYSALDFEVVSTFTRGTELIEYLKENHLDAVITDIKMPSINGIELAQIIQNDYTDTKVILISAYRDFEYAHSAIKYDVVSYITKPITQSEFIEALLKLKKVLDSLYSAKEIATSEEISYYDSAQLPEQIQTALQFINAHYGDDISLNDVARHSFMHPGYLSQLIKKHTNESYIDYLTKIRINKAKEFLATTDEKIAVIGAKVGYNYSQYFHKIFKAATGVTPHEYRKNNKRV